MQKFIPKFKDFTSRREISKKCEILKIRNFRIDSDGAVSVNGDVNLHDLYSQKFAYERLYGKYYTDGNLSLPIKFKEIKGDFRIGNSSLGTLYGCPQMVYGDFDCSYNHLQSLEYCPQKVGGSFNFSRNFIYNFDGLPSEFDCNLSRMNCDYNPIWAVIGLVGQNFPPYQFVSRLIEYDVIQGKDIMVDRLSELLGSFDCKYPMVFPYNLSDYYQAMGHHGGRVEVNSMDDLYKLELPISEMGGNYKLV